MVKGDKMPNLMQGLIEELNRNRELLKEYEKIPTGAFGATMIRKDIVDAEKVIGTGDVIEMLKCYEMLKKNEG